MSPPAEALRTATWSPASNSDEGLADLLQTEIILPSQYWAENSRDERTNPERRLLLAVLEDAVITLLRHRGRMTAAACRLVTETEAWVASNRSESPFDFVPLCEVLDLEVDYVRALLQRTGMAVVSNPLRRRSHAGRGHHKVRDTTRRRRGSGAA